MRLLEALKSMSSFMREFPAKGVISTHTLLDRNVQKQAASSMQRTPQLGTPFRRSSFPRRRGIYDASAVHGCPRRPLPHRSYLSNPLYSEKILAFVSMLFPHSFRTVSLYDLYMIFVQPLSRAASDTVSVCCTPKKYCKRKGTRYLSRYLSYIRFYQGIHHFGEQLINLISGWITQICVIPQAFK